MTRDTERRTFEAPNCTSPLLRNEERGWYYPSIYECECDGCLQWVAWEQALAERDAAAKFSCMGERDE